ncbi:PREDICTED: putative F-box protein At5g52620 [Camelina sativa]|uniref:F-box protein At5g52620 n=1 Tax=Camelina sativa TaxID=90675 RepID=A0ABM0ZBX8_CAMSA|nr:PREDICTED: putative F-box protein At5g52620 [Camelina sativa]
MDREGNSDPIPIDIILEILSRLSTKSIAKFGLASKFCASILSRPDFRELFLTTRSSSRPRLLFAVNYSDKWRLYSSHQPQNPDENHSLIVAADFHMEVVEYMAPHNNYGPVSGLLYFPSMHFQDRDNVPVICNPSTGQYARLPQLRGESTWRSLLGYDPIGKQYKVLAISNSSDGEGNILTLGTGKMSWSMIQGRLNHYRPRSGGICINGVLYYITFGNVAKIVCFDVRYEKLSFLDADSTTRIISKTTKLIHYKGRLGMISLYCYRRPVNFELRLWILEDPQIQKWLEHHYTLPVDIVGEDEISVVGVTANGEIVLSKDYISNPFFVFYFYPERNALERVGIQGFEALVAKSRSKVYTFVDYIEDFKFI